MIYRYLKGNRPAQCFALGAFFLVLGLVSQGHLDSLSRLWFYLATALLGYYATKEAIRLTLTERKPNVDLLMILAALVALLIGEEAEASLLLFIFAGAEVLERFVTDKSSAAITQLMAAVPSQAAIVLENGDIQTVATEQLKLGDCVLVSKGGQFPIDGQVLQETTVSEMALTGEAVPVEKAVGAEVFAGTVNLGHPVTVEVTKTSEDTVFSTIVRLVQEAQDNPSPLAQWIDTFEGRYVVVVLLTVPLFILSLAFFQGLTWSQAFYRGMVLLTVASPCALVASATPATLSAISHAAKLGVLIKGGQALHHFSRLTSLATDKTGTLTKGAFQVVHLDLPENERSLVYSMTRQSQHPISQAIALFLSKEKELSPYDTLRVEELAGQGLQAGRYRLVNAKAVQDLADPEHVLEGASVYQTMVFLADDERVLGFVALEDQLRPEAIRAVQGFQDNGIQVTMLTGDGETAAQTVATQTGIQAYKAHCLPADKARWVQEAVQSDVVAMIGDGINDAPALATAHIGIAMGSGSAIAMETADMVMMQNNLWKCFEVYRLSLKLERIIKQNVFFAVGVMVILVLLNIVGILDLPHGVIFHEGSTILVILNGLRLLKTGQEV